MNKQPPCPCGSGKTYAICCAPLHQGRPAASAEALMRSRYCAYVLMLETYLRATWDAATCPGDLALSTEPRPKWTGLEIRAYQEAGDTAKVEFIARYKLGGRAHRLHEVSRFRRQDERWIYVDGEFAA
ncbi:MAG: SEC-C domain-containing protein [Proteobacteria bacterium]|nr:SEC-C domain-containing protein [Pseudomonadota bacterium]HQR02543.1 YchJ family metal-binding protein [Rhodocyclaceae bacterium]